ncbi:MAG TPA: hypothetical protein VMD91_09420 [Candidatus Sulfotelmatobacter sp.]|nr:hypothetical protein [Candidatus Sulfotelmatobacter sp.]
MNENGLLNRGEGGAVSNTTGSRAAAHPSHATPSEADQRLATVFPVWDLLPKTTLLNRRKRRVE